MDERSEAAFQFITSGTDMFTARNILGFIRNEKQQLHEELKNNPPTLRRIHHYPNLNGLRDWIVLRYADYEYAKRQPIERTIEHSWQDWYFMNRIPRVTKKDEELQLKYLPPGVTNFSNVTELYQSWYDSWRSLARRQPLLKKQVRRYNTDVQAFNNMSLDDVYYYDPNDLYQHLFHHELRQQEFQQAVELNRTIRAGGVLYI